MRDLPRCTHAQFGVFTTAQARRDGWTPAALRYATATGRLLHPRQGLFALPTAPDDPDRIVTEATRRAVAAALAHRRAVVSHVSAARLLGLPVIGRRPRACITIPRDGRCDAVRAHVHRANLPASHHTRLGAVPLTIAARTVVDSAREIGTEAALAMADAALRTGRTTSAELADLVDACRQLPFIRRAAELADFADARAESALESRSRWRIRAAGLPQPRLQQVIIDEWGRFIARVDFYWDEYGVVGEADGEGKQQSLAALRAQHDRERDLRDLGLPVVRWGWADLDPFDGVAGRLVDAYARGTPRSAARRWRLAREMPW